MKEVWQKDEKATEQVWGGQKDRRGIVKHGGGMMR